MKTQTKPLSESDKRFIEEAWKYHKLVCMILEWDKKKRNREFLKRIGVK